MSVDIQAEAQASSRLDDAIQAENASTEATSRRRFNPFVASAVAGLLAVAGIGVYLYSQQYVSTDDAQVDGHLNPVSSRIEGTIKAIYADDNQSVQAGALLVELDPSDDQIAFDRARAQFDQAVAQMQSSNPSVPITRIGNNGDLAAQQAEVAGAEAAHDAAQNDLETAMARLKESQALDARDQADFARYQSLYEKQEVAHASYDQSKAAAEAQTQTVAANKAAVASAQKTVEQRVAQLNQARSRLAQIQSRGPLQLAVQEASSKGQQANAEAMKASLEQSRLNLNYCRIAAPVSGVVTQRSAEVGEHIGKGQQLFMVVQTADLWVTANFKETELARMHPGEPARIHVDALRADFDGSVVSMPAVTGSRTSVLPPENATGNYVKVIQRLPVRIRFNQGQKDLDKLRPGMSVEPKVHLD